MDTPDASAAYTVLDVETTGFSPERDRIVEVAVVRVEGGVVVDRWSSLINPGIPIPASAQATHGISDAAVRRAPSLIEMLPTIAARVSGGTIAAHNAAFDRSFLPSLRPRWLCTLGLARRAFPGAPNHRLGTLVQYLGIERQLQGRRLHRAGADAEATALLLLACLRRLRAAT